MIVFDLRCEANHVFEAWFDSSAAYEAQKARGLVSCPACDSTDVEKALMAPAVGPKSNQAGYQAQRARIAALRAEVEASCDYVGGNFAAVARARFAEGEDAPPRGIYGETSLAEAASLLEEGIPVAPLPFRPRSAADA
jgi:hypothetical protein